MKKLILLISLLLIFTGCCESDNQGYGYNTKSEVNVDQTNKETKQPDIFEMADQRRKNYRMTLRGLDGRVMSSCTVYKGEFDGHTWYVFYDNLAAPSVEHDPLCKCKERDGD